MTNYLNIARYSAIAESIKTTLQLSPEEKEQQSKLDESNKNFLEEFSTLNRLNRIINKTQESMIWMTMQVNDLVRGMRANDICESSSVLMTLCAVERACHAVDRVKESAGIGDDELDEFQSTLDVNLSKLENKFKINIESMEIEKF